MVFKQQAWIRNGWWDGFWILSGIPLGLFFWGLSTTVPEKLIVFIVLVLLQTGHLLSPMFLAWAHDGFRKIMLRQKIKYIVVPSLVMAATTGIGYAAGRGLTDYHPDLGMLQQLSGPIDFKNPLIVMAWLYIVWNTYHFAMQKFGVLCIYRNKAQTYHPRQRSYDKAFCFTHTLLTAPFLLAYAHLSFIHSKADFDLMRNLYIMISLLITAIMIGRELFAQPLCLPRIVFILCDGLGLSLIFWQGLIGFALYTANHWLVAIGLSSHIYSVHRSKTSDATHWYNSPLVFAFILIMASLICFGLLFVSFTPSESDISLANFTLQITALAFGIRAGLGFVHFLYDRYIYKFSDEQVRATIGKDMFMPELSAQPVLQPQLSATST